MSIQFFPHQLETAVDAINDHRNRLVDAAWQVLSGQRSTITALEAALQHHGLLLRAFHLVFDGTIDPRVIDEDSPSLFTWAAEYDRNFRDAYRALT